MRSLDEPANPESNLRWLEDQAQRGGQLGKNVAVFTGERAEIGGLWAFVLEPESVWRSAILRTVTVQRITHLPDIQTSLSVELPRDS